MNSKKKLSKKKQNHKVFGVCSGLSEYFNCDIWFFRGIFILATILNFKFGLINYIAFSLIMSNE